MHTRLRVLYYLKARPLLNKNLHIQYRSGCQVTQCTYFIGSGNVILGANVKFGFRPGGYFRGNCIEFSLRRGGSITIGDNTFFNNNVFISASNYIIFGANCLVGHNCEFSDADGHAINPALRHTSSGLVEPCIIGENVWFGNGCKILRGSHIGDNCIVGAGAVVKGKFEANTIIGGVPAKVIRMIEGGAT